MATQSLIKSSALKDVVQREDVKNRLKEIMGARAPQFAAALVQVVNQSWQLQKCDPTSVIGAALTAAALDLSIDPNIGEAHIVPYGDKAQFQIGYIGFSQLAMRSGQYKNLGWTVVHTGELTHWDELSGELDIETSKKKDDTVIGYASKFKLLNGFERGMYWTVEEITNHAKKFSKAYNAGLKDKSKQTTGWFTNFDRMALKTVLKSLLKTWGPKSIQMQKAIGVDEGAIIDADTGTVEYPDSTQLPSKPEFDEPQVEVPAAAAMREPVAEAPKPEPAEKSAEGYNRLKTIKGLIKLAGLKDEQVIKFLKELGSIGEACNTLEQVSLESPDVLTLLDDQHDEIFARIKGVKK